MEIGLFIPQKEWLLNQINRIPNKTYLLFDFPGQAELYSGIVFMYVLGGSVKGYHPQRILVLGFMVLSLNIDENMTKSS